MAYSPKTWHSGDRVTATEMNRIEDGIVAISTVTTLPVAAETSSNVSHSQANTLIRVNSASAYTLSIPLSNDLQVGDAINIAQIGAGDVLISPQGSSETGVSLSGTTGNYVTTPNATAFQITGDIDIRVKATLPSWTPATEGCFISKWNDTGGEFLFTVKPSGQLQFGCHNGNYGSADSGYLVNVSTLSTGFLPNTKNWIRVTRASSTGNVIFYTSDDGTTWTQLGSTLTNQATAAAVFSHPVRVGATYADANYLNGTVHRAQVRAGINGTIRGDMDPSLVTRTAARTPTNFTDTAGIVWTGTGSAWDWTLNAQGVVMLSAINVATVRRLAGPGSVATLVKTGANEYLLTGTLEDA